jgi:hypothetical protein
LVVFLAGLIFNRSGDTTKRVTQAGAATTIPFGLVLIYAALEPSALKRMADLPRGPLLLGGLATLCIYFEAATKK